jgi:TolB protein
MVSDWGGAHNNIWKVDLDATPIGFGRMTAGLADEDWPTVSDFSEMVYSDNVGNATRMVSMELKDKRRKDLAISSIDFGEPTRVVTLDVLAGSDEESNIGRVSIRQKNGRFYFPQGALYRITGGLGHFYARNQVSIELPFGEFNLVAYKGTEFREVRKSFDVNASSKPEVSIHFQKWMDSAYSQWYSGENHIHANYGCGAWYSDVNTVADQVEGEGLNVANMAVANSDGDGVFDRPFFIGAPDRRSTNQSIMMWNEEFRSTMWGHLTIVDLDRLVEPIFTGFADTTNPWDVPTNADISKLARFQGASVSYTHPAGNRDDPYNGAYSAKGLPVDAALGVIGTLDVMGFGYDATLPLWYRLLNCGFRIPAAAGTDCFLNRIRSFPPGWGRCYVRLSDGLDYDDWIEGQRLGHSFISTGPMIDFQVNGKRPGESITLAGSGSTRLSVSIGIQSQYPRSQLEIISNREIVDRVKLKPVDDGENVHYERLIGVDRSGWIAARVRGGAPSDYVGRRQVAHANPVYINMVGKPMEIGANSEYFLSWIDRLQADLERRNRYRDRRESVHTQLEEARAVYRALNYE